MPEPSWSPAGGPAEAAPAEPDRHGSAPGAPTERALDLALVRAAIRDGLLMVFGPEGDPVPPQAFGAAAAERPDAEVRLMDGPRVRAERVAAVLDAQMSGRLGSGLGGDEPWIRAMLGIAPQPEMAGTDDLSAEACTLDVVAFGKELMITSRNGATFLIADARARTAGQHLRLGRERRTHCARRAGRPPAGRRRPGQHRTESRPSSPCPGARRGWKTTLSCSICPRSAPCIWRTSLMLAPRRRRRACSRRAARWPPSAIC